MWEVKSMPRICKTSYGGQAFSNIFISLYVTLNGFLGQTDMSRWIYKCSQGPWAVQSVHSVQGSVNSILCTGKIFNCPHHRVHRVATAAFWRIFSDEGKISPGW
jgi:hypothetical protein